MVGFEKLKLGQISEGFWGSHTASIDWCETNYQYSPYIAEFINTLSNIPFIVLGLYGYMRCCQAGLRKRYSFTFLGLSLIGVGSFGFHMTLQWAWQLLDELPMIYLIVHCAFILFDTNPGFELRRGKVEIVGTLLFDLFVTLSYIYLPNPIYHQIAFASIQLSCVYRLFHLILCRLPPSSANPTRAQIGRLSISGVVIFASAFALWNVDNVFCETLRSIRDKVGVVGMLLEGHAWWHIGTGIGSYMILTAAMYLCLCVKTDVNSWDLEWIGFLPHVVPKIALPAEKIIKESRREKVAMTPPLELSASETELKPRTQ